MSFLIYIIRNCCRREQSMNNHNTLKGQHLSLGKGYVCMDWENIDIIQELVCIWSNTCKSGWTGKITCLKLRFLHPLAAFDFLFQNWWKALLISSIAYNFILLKHSLALHFFLSFSHPVLMCWVIIGMFPLGGTRNEFRDSLEREEVGTCLLSRHLVVGQEDMLELTRSQNNLQSFLGWNFSFSFEIKKQTNLKSETLS